MQSYHSYKGISGDGVERQQTQEAGNNRVNDGPFTFSEITIVPELAWLQSILNDFLFTYMFINVRSTHTHKEQRCSTLSLVAIYTEAQ